jgi:hypothetical protein
MITPFHQWLFEAVRFQKVLDKLDQKPRDVFSIHINLFCLFSNIQKAIASSLNIYCETQISKTNNLKVTIGELKFVSRTIPQSGGFNTPQRAFEFASKACFGVSYP